MTAVVFGLAIKEGSSWMNYRAYGMEDRIVKIIGSSFQDELFKHKEAGTYPYGPLNSSYQPLQIGQRCELSDRELAIANMIGPERYRACREAKLVDQRQDTGITVGETDTNGVSCEMLYCKYNNLYPEEQWKIAPRAAKDDMGDHIHNGFCVDSKWTRYNTGQLIFGKQQWFPNWIDFCKIDIFCLFTGEDRKYVFRGWMAMCDLIQKRRFDCLPNRDKPTYNAPQSGLTDFVTACERSKIGKPDPFPT